MFSEESRLFIHRIYNLWKQQPVSRQPKMFSPAINAPPVHTLEKIGIPGQIVEEIHGLTRSIQYEFVYGNRSGNRNDNGRKVILQFFAKSAVEFNKNSFKQRVSALYRWFSLANTYAVKTCSPIWILHIYFTDAKKELPMKIGTELTQVHCNTAFTYVCGEDTTDGYIFRYEEWFRVAIHESIHAFGLDFSLVQGNLAGPLRKLYPAVKSQILLSETYTETWATILNALFLYGSQHTGYTGKMSASVWSKFERAMVAERDFIMKQAAKILRHHRIFNYSDLFEEKKTLNDSVGAFAYYVLKSICLWNIDGFIQWSMIHNKGTLAFRNPERNSMSFFTFIEKSSPSEEYIEKINRLLICRNCNNDRSLRFTIIE